MIKLTLDSQSNNRQRVLILFINKLIAKMNSLPLSQTICVLYTLNTVQNDNTINKASHHIKHYGMVLEL